MRKIHLRNTRSKVPLVAVIFASVGLLVTPPQASAGDERLKLPERLQVQAGNLIDLRAETQAKKVVWRVPESVEYRTCGSGQTLIAVAKNPGVYRFLCFAAIADEPVIAECLVTVEGSGPQPNPPAPGPGPGPAPGPGPQPSPVNPLRDEIQRLYNADGSTTKAGDLAALAELYRLAADLAGRDTIKTTDELVRQIRSATANLLPADRLRPIRLRLGEEVSQTRLSASGVELTPELRQVARDLFVKISATLKEVK